MSIFNTCISGFYNYTNPFSRTLGWGCNPMTMAMPMSFGLGNNFNLLGSIFGQFSPLSFNPFGSHNIFTQNYAPNYLSFYPMCNFSAGAPTPVQQTRSTQTPAVQSVKRSNKTNAEEIKYNDENNKLGNSLVNTANKYLGYNEADGSSKHFSQSDEWCADFIKCIIDETYSNNGETTPTEDLKKEFLMPHLRVENIKQWGIKHGKYFDMTTQQNKAQAIAKNVKPGDIFIFRENNSSHTGFVTKVYADGSFDTIEGNRDDRVKTYHYSASDRNLSGFVQL